MSGLFDFSSWSVFQWILVVLAAGFIGQFGKTFAQFLMAKIKDARPGRPQKEKSAEPPAPGAGEKEKGGSGEGALGPGEEKILLPAATPGTETGASREVCSPDEVNVPAGRGILSGNDFPAPPAAGDKKALKARLKQEKKAAKAAKKGA